MLIPNNSEIDFAELNRRIAREARRYRQATGNSPAPAFNPSPAGASKASHSWHNLLHLEDEALIKAAYPTLLGREGSSAEMEAALGRLRSGIGKFELLASLRYSAEGKRHNAPVHGLRRARLQNALRNIPLLGSLAMTMHGWLSTNKRHQYYMVHLQRLESCQKQFQHTLALQQGALQELARQHQQYQTEQQRLQQVLTEHGEQLSQKDVEVQKLRTQLDYLSRLAAGSKGQLSSLPEDFYIAFENRFRGDEATLHERMSYYLPLLAEVPPLRRELPLVDIGCGRGEWLQMLPTDCKRIGIDLNALNVKACRERGQPAEQADAFDWLARQPEDSIAVISAFHVIEHLSFEQFNTLLELCMRALAPDGMLILETPNPENLLTAATHFHTDPTHLHPLPPAFTEFFVAFKGFHDVRIHRLNPIPREFAMIEESEVARRCNALFYGPQDYAVTACK